MTYFILIKSKLVISGVFFNFEINNITDNTIFYGSEFKQEFNNLIRMNDFNFNNIFNCFFYQKDLKLIVIYSKSFQLKLMN